MYVNSQPSFQVLEAGLGMVEKYTNFHTIQHRLSTCGTCSLPRSLWKTMMAHVRSLKRSGGNLVYTLLVFHCAVILLAAISTRVTGPLHLDVRPDSIATLISTAR